MSDEPKDQDKGPEEEPTEVEGAGASEEPTEVEPDGDEPTEVLGPGDDEPTGEQPTEAQEPTANRRGSGAGAEQSEAGKVDARGEPPVRVCPNCSAQAQTFDDNCPYCGHTYIRSPGMRAKRWFGSWSRRRKIITVGIIVVLLGGGIAAGAIIKTNHDNQVAQEKREEQEHREQVAEEKRQEERELVQEEQEQQELEEGEEELEKIGLEINQEELEKAIAKDAGEKVDEGLLEGPILRGECEPEGGELKVGVAAQNFHCMAVTDEEGGYYEGYRYSATYNYAEGEFSWRLGGE